MYGIEEHQRVLYIQSCSPPTHILKVGEKNEAAWNFEIL